MSYRNIVNYVTGNVQNVVPGPNLPLVFSSETTICHLYDIKNINPHTCYKYEFPYHFREGIIYITMQTIYSLWIDGVDMMADNMRMASSQSHTHM